MAKFYTGVGSRKAPQNVLRTMQSLASKLQSLGFTLRSGGAQGSDSAFDSGTKSAGRSALKRIYHADQATEMAMSIASQFHPAWDRCSDYVQRLHGRNSFQVLGLNLDTPSKFLVCWTPDGCISHSERTIKTGGTGTAISIANHYGVPVFNLFRSNHLLRILNFL